MFGVITPHDFEMLERESRTCRSYRPTRKPWHYDLDIYLASYASERRATTRLGL